MTKLTLTISDPSLIEEAKEAGRSLSALVENYLRQMTQNSKRPDKDDEISPLVKSLMGSVKVPEDWDYKKEIREAKYQKYLKK